MSLCNPARLLDNLARNLGCGHLHECLRMLAKNLAKILPESYRILDGFLVEMSLCNPARLLDNLARNLGCGRLHECLRILAKNLAKILLESYRILD